MASTQEIQAGKAYVRLFLKNDMASQLSRALKASGEKLKGFGRGAMIAGAGVSAAGAAILTPLVAAAGKFASAGTHLLKLSKQTGATVDQLSRLRSMANQTGVDFDDMTGAVEEMNIRLGETVRDGVGPMHDAFKGLGLDAEEIADLPVVDQFAAIGDALKGVQSQAERGFLADEILGGDAFKVLPFLLQGTEGIKQLNKEAEELGSVWTKADVKSAAEFTDAFRDIREAANNVVIVIGKALAPTITEFVNRFKPVVKWVIEFVKQNQGLIRSVAMVGTAIVVAGTAVTTFGLAIWGTGMALTALGSVVGVLLSPIGLITAAVVGGAVAWVRYSDSGKRAWASLKATALPIIETLKTAFGGIGDAISSGDWSLAGKIAMAALKLAFFQGLAAIQAAFPKTFNTVFRVVGKVGDGIVAAWAKVTGFLTDQWNSWGKSTLDTVLDVASQIVSVWQNAVEGLANWMLEQSAKGGVVGGVISKVLGVDMAEEQARSERLDRELGLEPTDVLADAREAVKQFTEQMESDLKAGLANAGGAADEFMQNLPVSVTGNLEESIEKFLAQLESGVKIEDAAKELAALREEAATQRATQAQEKVPSESEAGVPAAAGGLAAAVASQGVALTATYSAAAARIAGFQAGGGPEKQMATGISLIEKHTEETVRQLTQFLAGWRVA